MQVNRIWQHHFGAGIVATTDNLGVSGAPPSHPELLDYLAGRVRRLAAGASRRCTAMILGSAAYRQTSAHDDKAFERRSRQPPAVAVPAASGSTPRRSATRCWRSAAARSRDSADPTCPPRANEQGEVRRRSERGRAPSAARSICSSGGRRRSACWTCSIAQHRLQLRRSGRPRRCRCNR